MILIHSLLTALQIDIISVNDEHSQSVNLWNPVEFKRLIENQTTVMRQSVDILNFNDYYCISHLKIEKVKYSVPC